MLLILFLEAAAALASPFVVTLRRTVNAAGDSVWVQVLRMTQEPQRPIVFAVRGDTLPEAKLAIAAAHATSGEPDVGVSTLGRPLRLSIAASTAGGRIRLALALPGPGGEVELFDLMGRRLQRRDLGARTGRFTIDLESGAVPAGIYWARVQQGGDAATTRLVRIR